MTTPRIFSTHESVTMKNVTAAKVRKLRARAERLHARVLAFSRAFPSNVDTDARMLIARSSDDLKYAIERLATEERTLRRHDQECQGHPAGSQDPMGVTVYCDGTCRVAVQRRAS